MSAVFNFFSAIGKAGVGLLNPGGRVYVEINENYGTETAEKFLSLGFSKAHIIKDINGKDRIVKATL